MARVQHFIEEDWLVPQHTDLRKILIVLGVLLSFVVVAFTSYLIYRLWASLPTSLIRIPAPPPPPTTPPPPRREVNRRLDPRVIIEDFPTVYFYREWSDAPTFCPICMHGFGVGHRLCLLPACKHAFHRSCVLACFRFSNKCPLCRHDYSYLLGGQPLGTLLEARAPIDFLENRPSLDFNEAVASRANRQSSDE